MSAPSALPLGRVSTPVSTPVALDCTCTATDRSFKMLSSVLCIKRNVHGRL